MDIVKLIWKVEVRTNNTASRISAKFKLLRRILKNGLEENPAWSL
jgi:hypothetical protein